MSNGDKFQDQVFTLIKDLSAVISEVKEGFAVNLRDHEALMNRLTQLEVYSATKFDRMAERLDEHEKIERRLLVLIAGILVLISSGYNVKEIIELFIKFIT